MNQFGRELPSFFFFNKLFIFVCFGSSLLIAGFLQLQCAGFSLQWLLLLCSTGSGHAGFSSCGAWAQQQWLAGSRAQAQQLQHMGLVAPRPVGSSRTRARTRVPCIGRRILNHCATREAREFPSFFFFKIYLFYLFIFGCVGSLLLRMGFLQLGERGLLFIAVRRLLIAVASLVVEHGRQAHGLSSCGTRAQLLHGLWDLPGPGLETVSPALAGGFLTTVPPGKPPRISILIVLNLQIHEHDICVC